MRKSYPSDISREQFEGIKPLLESARRKTSPRLFCTVLYLPRSGCQWRMLPDEFPKWRTVHLYFAIWSESLEGGNLLEQALKKSKLVRPARNWGATAVEKLGAMAQRTGSAYVSSGLASSRSQTTRASTMRASLVLMFWCGI